MQQFKIYSSSAGSGKTYTLTKEYLKLALSTNESGYFKQILAITFTNDAAGEMKDRILTSLQGFADIDSLSIDKHAGNRQMLQQILLELNVSNPKEQVTEDILQKRASRVFSRILHEYSDFAVSTIDSFTNRVVSAFTEELELPYNYEVSLDINDFVFNAVDRLIDRVGGTDAEKLLTETLEEYILEKAEEGLSFRSLPADLANFAKDNLVNEKVLDFVRNLKNLDLQDFSQIRAMTTLRFEELKNKILTEAKTAQDRIEKAGLTVNDFNEKSTGVGGHFLKIIQKTDDQLTKEPSATVNKILKSDDWSHKDSKQKERVVALQPELKKHFEQIEFFKAEYLLLTMVVKNLYKISVLNEIEKELNDLKTEKNMVHISDFNKKVIQVVLAEPVPFIYERLGEKYNHILIDEFQDTSSLQWNNLLPLIANGLGKGYFSLLVGDAKQAIYGWRGGDMEQIVDLSKNRLGRLIQKQTSGEFSFLEEHYQTLQYHILSENLNTNYRSKAEIIKFNNDFFRTILDLNDETMPMLQDAYENFEQELPKKAQYGGHIQIEFIGENLPETVFTQTEKMEADDDFSVFYSSADIQTLNVRTQLLEKKEISTSENDKISVKGLEASGQLRRILRLIQELKTQGFDYQDIAILGRKNKHNQEIANFLSENNIPVISSDSLLLKTADAVRFMLSFFQVMHRPANALLKYECIHMFHEYILEEKPNAEDETWIEATLKSKKINVFFRYFRKRGFEFSGFRFSQAGIYDLSERFIQTFKLLEKFRQAPYLYRFLDVVLEYSLKESTHLADFLGFWEQKKEKLSISTPGDLQAVTVTSIHKSKGLEYPVVIVPFANWKFTHRYGSVMWADLQELGSEMEFFKTSKLPAATVSLSKNLTKTLLSGQYKQEVSKLFVEELNSLYVAFTRPIDRLYILGEFSEKYSDTEITVSKLLQDYLITKNIWQDETYRYILQNGNPKTSASKDTSLQPESMILEERPAVDWQRKVWQKRHPDADFIMDAENFDKEKERLNKLSQVLKKIKNAGEMEEVLQKMFFDGIIEKSELPDLKNTLQKLLSKPDIEPYFSENARFIPERQILHHSSATSKNPDRIVVNGQMVSILLFRGTNPTENDLKIFKHYDPLLRKMDYTTVEKITINLANQQVVKEE